MLKYTIMKIRSKISFSAFIKRMTIQELFLNQILKSFSHFYNDPKDVMPKELQKQFFRILSVCPLRHSIIMVQEYKKSQKAKVRDPELLGFDAINLKIKLMTNKNKFPDIFQKAEVDNKLMFEQVNFRNLIHNKI